MIAKKVKIFYGIYKREDFDAPVEKVCSWTEDTDFLNLYVVMLSLNQNIVKVRS